MTAIWLWNWGDGVRYAIEPSTEGGYDTVVEIGLQGSIDREHWDTLDAAKARFHDELVQRAEDDVDGAAAALAELDALNAAGAGSGRAEFVERGAGAHEQQADAEDQ